MVFEYVVFSSIDLYVVGSLGVPLCFQSGMAMDVFAFMGFVGCELDVG